MCAIGRRTVKRSDDNRISPSSTKLNDSTMQTKCKLTFYVFFVSNIWLFVKHIHFSDISEVKILVPGAGLGRLTYEFARRGFFSEGNEFSLFMIIASNFVLNKCLIENQYTIYPWVHQYVNNLTRQDQVRSITFPDVSPTQSPPKGTFNMVAGDFLQVI